MSDFDREAERERLREKYERDKQKREATEQMSELLLQGATMTNQHCPECHSPVFRHDGTTFCPTCQREVTEEGELAGQDGADASADGAAASGDGTAADAAPAEDATTGGDPTPTDRAGQAGAAEPAESVDGHRDAADEPSRQPGEAAPEVEQPTDAPAEPEPENRPAPARERRPARVDPPARREEPRNRREATAAEGGDLGEAEAALVREITELTRRAEETRDVGRKRDLFAATREATETLRELRRL